MRYTFGECEIDTATVELRVGGEAVAIEPQVFDVLVFLLEHRDRVVAKEELLDGVWHHRFVTESALTSRIKSARRVIGDDGRAQRWIRTVHGRGYQFVGEVTSDDDGARDGADVAASGPSLPAPPGPTVGRDEDIERVGALLERSRIVTLLGPGGVGKTRLALEAAWRWHRSTSADAVFVDLTKVRDPELVPALVVQELGVRGSGDRPDLLVLAEALRGRRLLLVLDNFEHVVAAAADLVALHADLPELRTLVTSRTRLRIAGEHVLDVEPLALEPGSSPDGEAAGPSPAVALFAQVASAVDSRFDLASSADDVAAICRAVDGLPLAIELAAGHVRTLPPVLLRARLAGRLGAGELATRDAPTRQQTIAATIEWSLDLLDAADRALFAQLGVFSGPVSLEAIEATCETSRGSVVDALARLVDQSLVRRVDGRDGLPRFSLLELVRERAREMLDESGPGAVADRHLDHFTGFVEDVERRRWTDLSARWLDLLTDALAEIRAARAWAIRTDRDREVVRIVRSLGGYWHREGHHIEGRDWVHDALCRCEGLDPVLVADLELTAGFVEWPRDAARARVHWERAVEADRALGRTFELAYALGLLAGTYVGVPDQYERGLAISEEALALARPIGNHPLIAQVLNVMGELARVADDDERALAVYEEGLTHARAARDDAHVTVFLANLAYMASRRGEPREAHRLASDALRTCWSLGRRMMSAWTVAEMAGPELALGRPKRAAMLIGAGDAALEAVAGARHPGDEPEYERVVEAIRSALGDDEYERCVADGAALPLDAAVRLALDDPPPG